MLEIKTVKLPKLYNPLQLLSASRAQTKSLPTELNNFYNRSLKNAGIRASTMHSGTQFGRVHLCFMKWGKSLLRAGSPRKMLA